MNAQPPKWADRFLQWYCNPQLLEEIQGDVYELYDRRTNEKGSSFANRRFVWDVIRFLRWSNIKKSDSKYTYMNHFILFRNYLKLGFRSITHNWVTSSINIFGLAISIGCAITVLRFVDMQLHMDSFHTKKDRIYQVLHWVEDESDRDLWGDVPLLAGPAMLTDNPAIEEMARVEYIDGNVRYGDDVFGELLGFVDPQFLEIFDFPMIYGNKDALYQKEQIVISRDMAVKYFGYEDPMGKEVSIKFSNGKIRRFFIGGIMDEYPSNASFYLHFYISMEVFFDIHSEKHFDWSYLTDATFILLKEGQEIGSVESSYEKYVELQNQSDSKWKSMEFTTISLPQLSKRSFEIRSSFSRGGHPAGRIGLAVIALLLLTMSCFNYMNISVASATKRLKEIALRKVMGGVRRQIIHQFLTENLLQCAFALIVGTALAYYLFLPGFNAMIPIHIPFMFSSWTVMIIFFVSLLVLIGLASGAYPAFYISRFQPIGIFRGNERFGSKNIASKILLAFQFFFVFVTIVGGFIFTDNGRYLNNKDWGYNPSGIIAVNVQDNAQYEQMKALVQEHPKIISIGGAKGHVGGSNWMVNVDHLGEQFRAHYYRVNDDYMSTLNLRLTKGRFLTARSQDQISSAVVNQKFVDRMGWEEAINQTFVYDSIRRTVVGVVEDFHGVSFYNEILPTFFLGMNKENANHFVIKTDVDSQFEVDQYLKEAWYRIAPDDPYEREFQSDVLNDFFEENNANVSLMVFISGLAIVLACLGLYGLLSFNIQRRLKEFSVRKVLGAAPSNIIKVASRQYIRIIVISFILGAPLGFFLIDMLITEIYSDPKATGVLPFIASISIVIITVGLTISGQIVRATKVNPSENLRNE